ncbi:hypothetical protein L6452_40158 [Arctium lappa]|uniref:Uncharacterized protein n=1 Tax=Arctium lappa TaxID=4217 RepID=A0ACB8XKJ3_ARCLA|nr:hypothetical protein L6452_40158 [Arctium lappa]
MVGLFDGSLNGIPNSGCRYLFGTPCSGEATSRVEKANEVEVLSLYMKSTVFVIVGPPLPLAALPVSFHHTCMRERAKALMQQPQECGCLTLPSSE